VAPVFRERAGAGASERGKIRACALLLLLATALAYANSLFGPLLFDDHGLRGASLQHRPLLWLSIRFDRWLSPADTLGAHIFNTLVHALAGLFLFGILRRAAELVRPGARGPALWLASGTALLWLVHPLQTESVSYLYQRAESLSGCFYLLTVYAFLRGAGSARRAAWQALALGGFALGMATKELVATAPLVILLLDRTLLAGSFCGAWRARRRFYLALWGLWAVLFGLLVSWELFQEHAAFGFRTASITPWRYALSQPAVILHYLRLVVWPHPLCLDYLWPAARSAGDWLGQLLLILVPLGATLAGLVRRRWWGLAGAWFFVVLAPTSSFMPITDLAAEHRMYLPLAAPLLLLVAALVRLERRLATGLVLLLAGLLIATTRRRNEDYRSELVMWQTVVERAPHNPRAHMNLGVVLSEAGRAEEAILALRRAVELCADYRGVVDVEARAVLNLGAVLLDTGRHDEAIPLLERACELFDHPHDVPVRGMAAFNLGTALLLAGRRGEAVARLKAALDLLADPGALLLLGDRLLQAGEPVAALSAYQRSFALEASPAARERIEGLRRALGQAGR
jgi:tetratricopeptide (TPR) repeat protein